MTVESHSRARRACAGAAGRSARSRSTVYVRSDLVGVRDAGRAGRVRAPGCCLAPCACVVNPVSPPSGCGDEMAAGAVSAPPALLFSLLQREASMRKWKCITRNLCENVQGRPPQSHLDGASAPAPCKDLAQLRTSTATLRRNERTAERVGMQGVRLRHGKVDRPLPWLWGFWWRLV